MTSNNYTTKRFDKEHGHFGGLIFQSDFNTDYRGKDKGKYESSDIAKRIAADLRWECNLQKIKTTDDIYKQKGE